MLLIPKKEKRKKQTRDAYSRIAMPKCASPGKHKLGLSLVKHNVMGQFQVGWETANEKRVKERLFITTTTINISPIEDISSTSEVKQYFSLKIET